MGPILHPILNGHPTPRAGTICPSLTSKEQQKVHTLASSKIIRARMTAGRLDLGCLKRDTSNPAQSSQIGARQGWSPAGLLGSCRTRRGCTAALPVRELRARAAGRDRDRDRQEPALLLHSLTPRIPLKLPAKVKSCRELSIPATQPVSPGREQRLRDLAQGRAVPCVPHEACAGAGELPVPPGCLLPSKHRATSNFPSWL